MYKESLHFRRTSKGALKLADLASETNQAWTDRNVRMWQSVWCNAEAQRRRIVNLYLSQRKLKA